MGILVSRLWRRIFGSDAECKIVIVGLNNAGKTTILYKLHLGQVVLTQPTIGSNVEEVRHDNLTFMVWDLGGQETLRASWSTYFEDTDAIVYVVDSNDQENMVLAKMELFNVVLHEDLKHACLLVLANKQDIQGCHTAGEIAEDLSLHTIRTHEWQIQSCCALTGEGLQEGLTWIAAHIRERRRNTAVLGGQVVSHITRHSRFHTVDELGTTILDCKISSIAANCDLKALPSRGAAVSSGST